jgi:hypothetical protein
MLSPVATLLQHIHDRKAVCLDIKRVDLGRGFYIEAVNLELYLCHEDDPGEQAHCGRVDAMHDGRWILKREWQVELMDAFGALPENCAIEGDEL